MDIGFSLSGRAEVVRGPPADDDAKLAFLLGEARRTQERLNELERRVDDEHASRVHALNQLRAEVNAAIGETVETSRLRFIRLRRLGLVFLVAGTTCLAIANLV
jgi:hypothetical protein